MQQRVPLLVGLTIFIMFTPAFAGLHLNIHSYSLIAVVALWAYLIGLVGMFVVLIRSVQ